MATAPIGRPKLYQSVGTSSPGLLKAQKSDGGNTFAAGSFTVLKGLTLVAYTAADTAVYGLSTDASHAATDEPYTAPFGENHNPVDPAGQLFMMNVTNATGQVGAGLTTIGDTDCVIGGFYSAVALSSVDTLAFGLNLVSKTLNSAGTNATNIFQIVDKFDGATYVGGDASTDYNGRVIVKVAPNGLQ